MDADIKFHEIEISGFRGFDYIKVSNLTNVNIFVGANNVGKSSILEAVSMLVSMENPVMPARLNHWRSADYVSLGSTRYLFHNMDLNISPVLSARTKTGGRRLTFSPVMKNEIDFSGDSTSVKIGRLDFKFDSRLDEEYRYHSALYLDNTGTLKQELDGNYKKEISGLFMSSEKDDSTAAESFSTLVKRNKKQIVIDAMRKFDHNIESVEVLRDGLYLKVANVPELLPISMAGDGVGRLINILSSIACEDYNVVLIDEIDTGLHYSAHKLLWSVLLDFIKDRNIQLFATTHNLECIESLDAVISSNEHLKPLASVFNVSRTKKEGFQAYRYSSSELRESIKNEIEIR